ncbi:uncharacterized protein [Drosophila tropicalis]|uniref:uncharacterized protein n=1 Tax=Drosophila tropicalis TaxID=46794 RepID=UPI0035ABABA1
MEKNKLNDDLLNRIKNELTAILEEEATGDPDRKVSYEMLMKPNPLPLTQALPKSAIKKSGTIIKSASYRQANSGKTIHIKPSNNFHQSEKTTKTTDTKKPEAATDSNKKWNSPKDPSLRVEFLDSQAAKSIDDEMQKMQLELKQSYELFQGISEKFESISFGGLKNRIRDLHLNNSNNEIGKMTTMELQKVFETRYLQNRLDKLTSDVSQGFRRHPGEFGDIPELSRFLQACTQLERGLGALKKQRRRSSDLGKRLCWATEIAYDRVDEIRNAVGSKPETNF